MMKMNRSGLFRATRIGAGALAVALVCGIGAGEAQAQRLTTDRIASGLSSPLYVTAAPGDLDRLFIIEQVGRIRILLDGDLLGTPYLDITDRVRSGGERGLLGMAFHPDYATNGYFFVNYTNTAGDTIIARFTGTGDPNIAEPASEEQILFIDQPYSNHNAGGLEFSPNDGYLYIGMGDGGSGCDPGARSQDPQNMLGKYLRLDVDNGLPYTIPADNPFVNDPNTLDEIWTLGWRNPWRWSFDRKNGDLYSADVGQVVWEEISFDAGDSIGGANFGWDCREGAHCSTDSNCNGHGCSCDDPSLIDPIYEYRHASGRCSITGGYVYRGGALPWLDGTYFFADWCTAEIWSFLYDGQTVRDYVERTDELRPDGFSINQINSFGEDNEGELYIVDQGGEVFRIRAEMELATNAFVGGETAYMRIDGGQPNQAVYVAYSLVGPGETFVGQLNVTLNLRNPQLAVQGTTNASGGVLMQMRIPGIASGRDVWLQAVQSGNASNVVFMTIQ